MNLNKNHKGFTLIEILLAILAITIIIFGIFTVWYKDQTAEVNAGKAAAQHSSSTSQ